MGIGGRARSLAQIAKRAWRSSMFRAFLRQTSDGGSGRAIGWSPPVGRAACWAYEARLAGRGGGLRDGCVVRAAADPAAVSGVLDQPVLCIQIELSHEVV